MSDEKKINLQVSPDVACQMHNAARKSDPFGLYISAQELDSVGKQIQEQLQIGGDTPEDTP